MTWRASASACEFAYGWRGVSGVVKGIWLAPWEFCVVVAGRSWIVLGLIVKGGIVCGPVYQAAWRVSGEIGAEVGPGGRAVVEEVVSGKGGWCGSSGGEIQEGKMRWEEIAAAVFEGREGGIGIEFEGVRRGARVWLLG